MKVIIKYKVEGGRSSKYRAGSLQDLPEAEALRLIEEGKAVPYEGAGSVTKRETRTVVKQPPKPIINDKRALKAAKVKREQEEAKAKTVEQEKLTEPAVKEAKPEEKGSEDGVKKDNGGKRKSHKQG